ncbi:MAG: 1,4-dihydroxy-6-naphthoate synthase [Fibrobacter sp.]|nr:1,4-dihydroxy-6-naphthoate synthase [Fibrobacter sp.]
MAKSFKVGISPCPNDTYIFEGWALGHSTQKLAMETHFADVQTLNEMAQQGSLDVLKVSAGVLPLILEEYVVLSAGGAMGYGCGPLLLAHGRSHFDPDLPVILPGQNTTAAVLFRRWSADKFGESFRAKCEYAFFDEVYRRLQSESQSQGVVIHEHRFTYAQHGLNLVADLGQHWEEATQSPIPLGVIVAKRSLGTQVCAQITAEIQHSLRWAQQRASLSSPWIASHAQCMDPEVMEQHISMFVNEFSMHISTAGQRALQELLHYSTGDAEMPEIMVND